MRATLHLSICIAIFAMAQGWGVTQYVDDSVPSSGNGTSWATAFKAIQEGIDAASNGDTVIVAEGTYFENIHFDGKNIILRSTDPTDPDVVANTVIDGNQAGSVVTLSGTETEACVLSGFTIRNGKAEYGGGISGGTAPTATHATIRDNTITGNSAETHGGGLSECDGTIAYNTITDNSAQKEGEWGQCGGGLSECDGVIENNTITENSAYRGGGLHKCDGVIQNNRIMGNSAATQGGGLYVCAGTIQNNRITENPAISGGGLDGCHGIIRNNTIAGNSSAGCMIAVARYRTASCGATRLLPSLIARAFRRILASRVGPEGARGI